MLFTQDKFQMNSSRISFFSPPDLDSISENCATCPTSKHCCYRAKTIVVLNDEAEAILNITENKATLIRQNEHFFVIKKEAGEACPFLTVQGACGIYDVRPRDCRSWPITYNNPPKHGHYSTDSNCPAVVSDILPGEFIEHSIKTLWTIPKQARASFATAIHLDKAVLPLIPMAVNMKPELNK